MEELLQVSMRGAYMGYQYILFDLDGTVTNPKVGITKSVAYALDSFGIKIEDLDSLCKFIGPPLTDSFKEFYNFNEAEIASAVSKYREYFSTKGLYENEMYPGIKELLEKLKQNEKTIILATSKPTFFAEKILEYFDLAKYFDFVAGSEMDLSRNTKTSVIKYALEQVGITNNSRIIMVGDRKHDIIGAKENEIKSVGVLYGFGDKEELMEAGADYIVENITELSALLNE